MSRVRTRSLPTILALGSLLAAAPSADALGLSLPASVTLGNLAPGRTATAPGISAVVTGVVTGWTLTVAPSATPTPGHLRATSGTCSGGEAALTHPLHLDVTAGSGATTLDQPSYDATAGTTQLAHGTLPDGLRISYSQLVDPTEMLAMGCVYSLSLTFTLS